MDGIQSFIEQYPIGATAAAASVVGFGLAARIGWSVFYSGSGFFAPVIRTIDQNDAIAFSFDDGPTEPFTSQILDILADHKSHASFFVIGRHVEANKKLLRRMVDEGHTIGNHTWDHHHHGIMGSLAYWVGQVEKTSAAIEEAAGVRPMLFRAPMGFKTPHQAKAVAINGAKYVAWRLRAWDTMNVGFESVVKHIGENARGGDIVTMHDGLEPSRSHCSQAQTVNALPEILKTMKDRGLRCISLQEALNFHVYC
ncbi:MAG TPA: polysaccharide deacetylase family protein [Phycisphaerae bacterium]|nr:polysaccharide deacetylase family protein [Phycisphaerae bacterium]